MLRVSKQNNDGPVRPRLADGVGGHRSDASPTAEALLSYSQLKKKKSVAVVPSCSIQPRSHLRRLETSKRVTVRTQKASGLGLTGSSSAVRP